MCGFLDVLSIDLSDNKKHNALYWKINDKLQALGFQGNNRFRYRVATVLEK